MHRSAQVALLALLTGIGIAISPVAAQTNPPAPPAAPAAPPVAVPASQCAAVGPLSAMPDGSSANRATMDAFNTTYTAWVGNVRTRVTCLRAEGAQFHEQARPRVAELNTVVTRVNAINDYWNALVNHLNGQSQTGTSQACAQQQHDIVAGEFHDRCDQQEQTAASTTTPAEPPPLPDVATLGSGPVTPANSLSQCAAIPEPDRPPNIERARTSQVVRAVTNYNTWFAGAQSSVACRRAEVDPLAQDEQARLNEANDLATQLTQTGSRWTAEAAEFNARSGAHH